MNYKDYAFSKTMLDSAVNLLSLGRIDGDEAAKGMICQVVALINPAPPVEVNEVAPINGAGLLERGVGQLVESTSGDVLIAKTRIDYLERVESDISRLVALIGLHDGSVAINAQAATSALTAEIGELIAKYKA